MLGAGSNRLRVPIPSPVRTSECDEPPPPPSQRHTPQRCRRSLGCAHMDAHPYVHPYTHTCTHRHACTHPNTHARLSLTSSSLPSSPAPLQGKMPAAAAAPSPSPLPLLSPGLPEEQRADVCSVTICILLDSIIISITPSFHPRSSAVSGNRDGWSLLAASWRGGGGSHAAALGMLSPVTAGEVTRNQ